MRKLGSGKPLSSYNEYIVLARVTQGTETSKYLEEKKEKFDYLSSGERNGNSPNQS